MAEPVIPDEVIDLTDANRVLPVRGLALHDPCPGLNSGQWAQFGTLTDNPPVWFFVRERDAVLMPLEDFKRLAFLAGHVLNNQEAPSC